MAIVDVVSGIVKSSLGVVGSRFGERAMKELIEVSCHADVDPKLSCEVMAQYGGLLMDAIEAQTAANRPQFVTFQHESDDGALMIYAATPDVAQRQGFRVQNRRTKMFSIVMPLSCDLAKRISREVLGDKQTVTFCPEPDDCDQTTISDL